MSIIAETTPTGTYPECVYKHARGGENDLPVEVVEKIASTKPKWADFDQSEIGGFADSGGELLIIWSDSNGDSAVRLSQEAWYDLTGVKLGEGDPLVRVWVGDAAALSSQQARSLSRALLAAAGELEAIEAGS